MSCDVLVLHRVKYERHLSQSSLRQQEIIIGLLKMGLSMFIYFAVILKKIVQLQLNKDRP